MEYGIFVRHGQGHLTFKEDITAETNEVAKTKALDWLFSYKYIEKVTEMKLGAKHLPFMLTVTNGRVAILKAVVERENKEG
jgi:hypothetical protein